MLLEWWADIYLASRITNGLITQRNLNAALCVNASPELELGFIRNTFYLRMFQYYRNITIIEFTTFRIYAKIMTQLNHVSCRYHFPT